MEMEYIWNIYIVCAEYIYCVNACVKIIFDLATNKAEISTTVTYCA